MAPAHCARPLLDKLAAAAELPKRNFASETQEFGDDDPEVPEAAATVAAATDTPAKKIAADAAMQIGNS